jgi:foldase protein PrsA
VQRSTKWIAAIVAVILVVGSVIATTSAYWGTDNTDNQVEEKPLDTSSKKIAGEFNGGKVTEGELNTYINVNLFFNPQLALIFSDLDSSATDEEKKAQQDQQKQYRQQFANQYLTKKYIASLLKVTPEQQKTIDQERQQLEQQIVPFAVQSGNSNAKTLQDAIQGKGFTQSQLRAIVEQDSKVELYLNAQIANMTYDHVKLRHVLVTFTPKGEEAQEGQPNRTEDQAKARALEVKKKLEASGDWAKLAKEYSEDPGSKEKGGLYESDVRIWLSCDGSGSTFPKESERCAKRSTRIDSKCKKTRSI